MSILTYDLVRRRDFGREQKSQSQSQGRLSLEAMGDRACDVFMQLLRLPLWFWTTDLQNALDVM
jgi:hypothetical protein